MDIGLIRRMAAEELEKRAFAELTGEEDTSLDSIFLAKAAQAEDPELFRIAMRMEGDPIGNYEVLGGAFKKQAFGQAMFKAAPAPDPKVQATGAKPPTASGPKAPSGPTGPTGGGGTGAPAVQSVPSPSVSGGPASAGAGVGMG
jgi:hypothetical protein